MTSAIQDFYHNQIIARMSLRGIVGGVTFFMFCKQFLAVTKMPFDYHYHPNEDQVINLKQGNYVLSVKYFQHVLNKYLNPKEGDLVIFQKPDRSIEFRIVQAAPRTYYYDHNAAMEYYVPNGYVVLLDPLKHEAKMESIGNVRGNQHFVLF